MKRDKSWGQDSPMLQLRVILGSIEGDLLNITQGIATITAAPRALKHCKDAQILATAIAAGDDKWDPEPSSIGDRLRES